MTREERQKTSKYWILLLCILLLILVFASGIFLGIRLGKFTKVEPYTEITLSDKDDDGDKDNTDDDDKNGDAEEEFVPQPGIAIVGQNEDGSVVADISIFRATYGNNEDEITVRSLGGEKVVAPGTTNKHIVRVMNTGNCALDYELFLQDLFPQIADDRTVPIEIRLTDSKGRYVMGSDDEWIPLKDLDQIADSGTVGKHCYEYYTLEWRWPFETETNTDVYDTLLGTLSETEIIECGIKIKTYATLNPDANAQGGIWVPQTGDYSQAILWVALSGVTLGVILILVFGGKRRHDEEE